MELSSAACRKSRRIASRIALALDAVRDLLAVIQYRSITTFLALHGTWHLDRIGWPWWQRNAHAAFHIVDVPGTAVLKM